MPDSDGGTDIEEPSSFKEWTAVVALHALVWIPGAIILSMSGMLAFMKDGIDQFSRNQGSSSDSVGSPIELAQGVRGIVCVFVLGLVFVSLEGFFLGLTQKNASLPVDKISSVLLLIGAAQRACSDLAEDPIPSVSEARWAFGLAFYTLVCFYFLIRPAPVVIQLAGFISLSRWSHALQLSICVLLLVAFMIEDPEDAKDKESSENGEDGNKAILIFVKRNEDIMFRFAALGVVLMCYPSIKLSLPSSLDGFDQRHGRIGQGVRGSLSVMSSWRGMNGIAIVDAVMYGAVFETILFKFCLMSLACLLAKAVIVLPVLLNLFPRSKCSARDMLKIFGASTITESQKQGDGESKDSISVDMHGSEDSVEGVCSRIKLRSTKAVEAAFWRLLFLNFFIDSYMAAGKVPLSFPVRSSFGIVKDRVRGAVWTKCVFMCVPYILAFARGAQAEMSSAAASLARTRPTFGSLVVFLAQAAFATLFGLKVASEGILMLVSSVLPMEDGDVKGATATLVLLLVDAAEMAGILFSVLGKAIVRLQEHKTSVASLHRSRGFRAFIDGCVCLFKVLIRALVVWACLQSPVGMSGTGLFQGFMLWRPLQLARIILLYKEGRALTSALGTVTSLVRIFCVHSSRSMKPVPPTELAFADRPEACAICAAGLCLDAALLEARHEALSPEPAVLSEKTSRSRLRGSTFVFVETPCCKNLCHSECMREWLGVTLTCPTCHGQLIRGVLHLGKAVRGMRRIPTLMGQLCYDLWPMSKEKYMMVRHTVARWWLTRKLEQTKAEYERLAIANDTLKMDIDDALAGS